MVLSQLYGRVHDCTGLNPSRNPAMKILMSSTRGIGFAYLGNGYTDTELDPDGNSVWYFDSLRDELELGKKAYDVHADVVISKEKHTHHE